MAFDRPRRAPWTAEYREFHVLVGEKATRHGTYGFVVRRYDRDGHPLWEKTFGKENTRVIRHCQALRQ
jgi:hypothetical protein